MLSVADRRRISMRALFDVDYRQALIADPRAAIAEVLGRSLPDNTDIKLVEESMTDWTFVLLPSAQIEGDLPDAVDARDAVENEVYTALRDEPQASVAVKSDPVLFLRDRFNLAVLGVDLHEEEAGQTVIVLPNNAAAMGEELSDEMLDLVSAGGDPNCQSGYIQNPYNSNPAPR